MKKIITLAITAAMAASLGTAAFANEGEDVIVQGDLTTLSDTEAVSARFTGSEVKKSDALIDENTLVFDIKGDKKDLKDVKDDDTLIIFTDNEAAEDAKAPYAVIKDEDSMTNVMIDLFKKSETLGDYVDTQNNLAINVFEETVIVDADGEKVEDIDNKYLMVFYDITTMSIPAIANPVKVIVLDEEATPEASPEVTPEATMEAENVNLYKLTVDERDVIEKDGVKIIPVRKYAESMDLEVAWNGEDMSVTIGTIPMGVNFKIGENSYNKSRMTPFVLDIAPQLINDTTYVPASFFEQILEAEVTIATAGGQE